MPTHDVFDNQDIDGPRAVLGPVDAREEDAFWQQAYRREHYYSAHLEYEDYAPAYCVGYIGYAQYGGAYDDAETSLCANWERIKSDSRLTLEEARLAMRAAWDRMAARGMAEPARNAIGGRLMAQRPRTRPFRLAGASLR